MKNIESMKKNQEILFGNQGQVMEFYNEEFVCYELWTALKVLMCQWN